MISFPRFFRHLLPVVFLHGAGMAAAVAQEAVPIFNGTDLSGWKIPPPNFWTVADGVLTGTSDEAQTGCMLWTGKEYGDFELEAEAKWMGDIDSGFMLRKPELQLQIGISSSLKIDMTGCFYLGKYPEAGRAKDREKLLKPGGWNHFKIQAKGDIFTVWINGTEAVKYQDAKFAGPGPIGLQIHPKITMKVEFKNLKVKELQP